MNQFFQGFPTIGERGGAERICTSRKNGWENGERTGTDSDGSSSPLFSAFSRVLRLLRVSVTVKKKELPAEEVTSLTTVSDKNSWGT